MSIEKLNRNSQSEIENFPFVQVYNHVVIHIKDNDAFRIWVFLLSKSMDWIVIKEWTAKNCLVKDRKARKVWSYLQRCNLITTIPVKNSKGQIERWDLKVLNGTEFNENIHFIDPESKQSKLQKEIKKSRGAEIEPVDGMNKISTKIQRCKKPPCGETTPVVFAPLLKKDVTKERNNTKQIKKSFYAQKAENKKKHDFAESMNQMANEARHIRQHEEFKKIEISGEMPDSIKSQIDNLRRFR